MVVWVVQATKVLREILQALQVFEAYRLVRGTEERRVGVQVPFALQVAVAVAVAAAVALYLVQVSQVSGSLLVPVAVWDAQVTEVTRVTVQVHVA